MKILSIYENTKDYVEDVRLAADNDKDTFGFLPGPAYDSQARQNKLWVAVDDSDKYIGHLMFGGVFPILKIIQINISKESRGQGVASKLLNNLKRYGEKEHSHTLEQEWEAI